MEGDYLTRTEHVEYARRMDAENERQNHRIAALEENVKEINRLTISVEKMAQSTESMAKELGRQGTRLEALETAPMKRWSTALTTGLGAAIGAGITALVAVVIGML